MADVEETNVVRLVPAAQAAGAAEEDEHQVAMVETLERLLERAKTGELRSLLVAYMTDDFTITTAYGGRVNPLERIGLMTCALARLTQSGGE